MSYFVKEIYYTLQGEGAQTGRPAVFCRFSGCNLWSGREEDRHAAICSFCDTDFRGTDGPNGGVFLDASALARAITSQWPNFSLGRPYVVFTGGEPLLQLDTVLTKAMKEAGFDIAVETNGTRPLVAGIDWVCVSPKAGTELLVVAGDELKLVFPQSEAPPEKFANLSFTHFYLQPMDGPEKAENEQLTLAYCLANPNWKMSNQTHKWLRIP